MIESILDKAGIEKKLTKLLVDFSLSKIAELKSWNIGMDLFDISKLLLNENDRTPILSFKNKNSADFKAQKTKFVMEYQNAFEQLKKIGIEALKLISDNGLIQNDFSRKAVFNHFEKISNGQLDRLYENKLDQNFQQSANIYNKSLAAEKKIRIDGILPKLFDHYKKAKLKVGRLFVLKIF